LTRVIPYSSSGASSSEVEQRLRKIEESVDDVRRYVATLHESIAADFKTFEENLALQNNAIQSAKTAKDDQPASAAIN
jgi:hypothetical protein